MTENELRWALRITEVELSDLKESQASREAECLAMLDKIIQNRRDPSAVFEWVEAARCLLQHGDCGSIEMRTPGFEE